MIGKRAQAKTCEAIKGILEEGDEIMDDYDGSEALDAGLLAAVRRSSTMKCRATAR